MKFFAIAAIAVGGFAAYWFFWREKTYTEQAQDWAGSAADSAQGGVSSIASAATEYVKKAREAVGV